MRRAAGPHLLLELLPVRSRPSSWDRDSRPSGSVGRACGRAAAYSQHHQPPIPYINPSLTDFRGSCRSRAHLGHHAIRPKPRRKSQPQGFTIWNTRSLPVTDTQPGRLVLGCERRRRRREIFWLSGRLFGESARSEGRSVGRNRPDRPTEILGPRLTGSSSVKDRGPASV